MEQEIQLLRQFAGLKDVPDDQLQWLIENSEINTIADETFISIPGQNMGGPYFLLEGNIELFMRQGNENREIRVLGFGDIFGYLPYSRGLTSSVYSKALVGVKILAFKTEMMRTMMRDHFELTQALVHIMNNRVKDFTALQQQNDKMAALGKMSAGLAHELNNPAAALTRDATALRNHLKSEPKALKELAALQLNTTQIEHLNHELLKVLSIKERPRLSLKEKTKQEELLATWFDKKNIPDADELSETFTDLNVDIDNLESFEQNITSIGLPTILNWVKNVLVKEKIIDDIQVSASRIGELIQSIKIYTHMDRGVDKTRIYIHEGIRNTLQIFGHKIRKSNVTLIENFDETLPHVLAYPGELNQVWTNLIDNALDAMEQSTEATLSITTERDREFVKVTINDNGSGIPDTIQQNIFDPFFTTKDIGKGTGMGLDTVQHIIQKHKGTVKVTSVPGNTKFVICFPLDSTLTNTKHQD